MIRIDLPERIEKDVDYSMRAKGGLLLEVSEDTEKVDREKADVVEEDVIQFLHNGID